MTCINFVTNTMIIGKYPINTANKIVHGKVDNATSITVKLDKARLSVYLREYNITVVIMERLKLV